MLIINTQSRPQCYYVGRRTGSGPALWAHDMRPDEWDGERGYGLTGVRPDGGYGLTGVRPDGGTA